MGGGGVAPRITAVLERNECSASHSGSFTPVHIEEEGK
jgi:hypothetical protein